MVAVTTGGYTHTLDVTVNWQNADTNQSSLHFRYWVYRVSASTTNAAFQGGTKLFRVYESGYGNHDNNRGFDFRAYRELTVVEFDALYNHDANGYLTVNFSLYFEGHTTGFPAASAAGSIAPARLPKPPPAPSMVALDQITVDSMRARFSGNGDNGSPITGWKLQHATSDAFTDAVVVASSGTSTIGALPSGVQRWVRACGTNARGDGPWSAPLTARTLQQTAAPTVTSPGPGEMRVAWVSPPGNLVSNPIGWDVQYAPTDDFTDPVTVPVGVSASPWPRTGLAPGARLWVRVRPRYSDAEGPWGFAAVVDLMSGVYASDGDEWDGAGAYASNGAALAVAQVLYSDGASWTPAI